MKVIFKNFDEIDDKLLKFAVIMAKYNGKWIFCRHKERSTWEIPGGHREQGENIFDTAQRELCEETGAEDFGLIPVSVYGVDRDGEVTYGGLFCADVDVLGKIPEEMEIAEIQLFDNLPENLTYPGIQPYLYERVSKAVQ